MFTRLEILESFLREIGRDVDWEIQEQVVEEKMQSISPTPHLTFYTKLTTCSYSQLYAT
jgi:hypothetical protein